jgi:hypothetical protein
MDLMRLIQEGGPGAYGAIALGMLGFVLGAFALVALAARSRASFSLGVVTLLVAAATAGAGIGGTFYGRRQTERALGYVGSGLDRDRIHRAGFREAQSSSLVGFFAALLPLALGGAASVLGARLQRPRSRVQGLAEPVVSGDEGAGQLVVGGIFVGIAALALAGAWVVAHGELPKARYPFSDEDSDAWALAAALEDLKDGKRPNGCEKLAYALDPYWNAPDKREWPRKFRRQIPAELSGWRAAADGCAKQILDALDSKGSQWTRGGLLDSPLLQDDGLRARALEEPQRPDEAPPRDDEPRVGSGSLARESIAAAIRADLKGLRGCYEHELTKTPTLEGKIVVKFLIGPDGKVHTADDASDQPFPSAKVTSCVLARVRALSFPKPIGGGEVTVKYPFIFKSSN